MKMEGFVPERFNLLTPICQKISIFECPVDYLTNSTFLLQLDHLEVPTISLSRLKANFLQQFTNFSSIAKASTLSQNQIVKSTR
jgi:hypothetical protein